MREDLLILGQQLAQLNFGFWRFRVAVDKREQEFHRLGVASHRVVDETAQHDLKGGDPTGLAVFGHRDFLLKDVLQDRTDRPTPFRATPRIAAFARRKLSGFGRTAITDKRNRRSRDLSG